MLTLAFAGALRKTMKRWHATPANQHTDWLTYVYLCYYSMSTLIYLICIQRQHATRTLSTSTITTGTWPFAATTHHTLILWTRLEHLLFARTPHHINAQPVPSVWPLNVLLTKWWSIRGINSHVEPVTNKQNKFIKLLLLFTDALAAAFAYSEWFLFTARCRQGKQLITDIAANRNSSKQGNSGCQNVKKSGNKERNLTNLYSLLLTNSIIKITENNIRMNQGNGMQISGESGGCMPTNSELVQTATFHIRCHDLQAAHRLKVSSAHIWD